MRRHAEEACIGEAVIVNTCAVTGEAVRQASQAIRRARRENPGAKIIVTGCAAQTEPDRFARMDEVDFVIGNAEKLERATFAGLSTEGSERVQVNDIMSVKETAGQLIDGFGGRARAYVQVQNGCDHRCTFCIIPFGRGPSRSVPAGAVVDQVRLLVERGYKEVVLSGVDMTSWGQDLPGQPRLGTLVRQILRHVPELRRLRLSSIDQVEVDDALMRAIGEEARLMPHFHLSLQAGADLILKRMKRRHLRRDAIAFCDGVRRLRPDVVFGADLIAGFPTETEDHFQETLAIVEDCGLTFLHVFPFSPRAGTPAARMPQLPGGVAKERAGRLRAKGEAVLSAYLDRQVGAFTELLMESDELGRSPHYAEARLEGAGAGDIVPVRFVGRRGNRLHAEAVA
jgi:threonylcarbamoyladenosine tRNA methylthiotransferase MtaB